MSTNQSNGIEISQSRTRDTERMTRVHLTLFDRAKFTLLFAGTYLFLVWAAMRSEEHTSELQSH